MSDESTDPQSRHAEEPGSRGLGARFAAAPVTVILMVLCVGAFLSTLGICAGRIDETSAMLADSWLHLQACGETLTDLGALRMANLWLDGSWWRVIAAGLLHGSWLHLILNTWSLWVVGEWAETTWGHSRMAVLFGLSSVGGCLSSAAWVEAPMVVGASAGIMGIAGALLAGRVLGRGPVGDRLKPLSPGILGGWLVVLVGLGFFVDVIAQAGHLGGLFVGTLLGAAWSGREAILGLAGRFGVALGFAGMILMARQPQERPHYYEYLGQELLERDRNVESIAAFEKALAEKPGDGELSNGVAYSLAKAGVSLERAEELVMHSLMEEPENPDYLDTLGWIYCRRGETEAGMELLRKASDASGGEIEEIEGHLHDCADAVVEDLK